MRRRAALAVTMAIAGLALATAPAAAGGWATVGIGSLPDGTRPGEPWLADLTILQHGRTPLEGLHPTLTIASGVTTRTFRARPTSRPGVYRARVVFPSAGAWRYVVNDDFSATHSFGPVRIGGSKKTSAPAAAVAATPPPSDGGARFPWGALGAALGAGLVAAWIVVSERRRRPGGAGAAAEG
jgi:hypothetical protein